MPTTDFVYSGEGARLILTFCYPVLRLRLSLGDLQFGNRFQRRIGGRKAQGTQLPNRYSTAQQGWTCSPQINARR
jgi:hypothetical protein